MACGHCQLKQLVLLRYQRHNHGNSATLFNLGLFLCNAVQLAFMMLHLLTCGSNYSIAFSAHQVFTSLARRLLYSRDLKRQSGFCFCSRHESHSSSILTLWNSRLIAVFVMIISPLNVGEGAFTPSRCRHSPMIRATAFSTLPAAETMKRLSFFRAWSQLWM